MIYVRYAFMAISYFLILCITYIPAAILVSISTREEEYGKEKYTWGGIFGTFDNPPQGDEGYVRKRSYFPGVTTGFKGYLNRVGWMLRNPLYGLSYKYSKFKKDDWTIVHEGDMNISDKYKIPGSRTSKVFDKNGKVVAFEKYMVKPWSKNRCLRLRMGWKIKSSKVEESGLMQFVFTCNPLDGYGND